jgi:hypothetical protein
LTGAGLVSGWINGERPGSNHLDEVFVRADH